LHSYRICTRAPAHLVPRRRIDKVGDNPTWATPTHCKQYMAFSQLHERPYGYPIMLLWNKCEYPWLRWLAESEPKKLDSLPSAKITQLYSGGEHVSRVNLMLDAGGINACPLCRKPVRRVPRAFITCASAMAYLTATRNDWTCARDPAAGVCKKTDHRPGGQMINAFQGCRAFQERAGFARRN
jgi:hypothetical protein